jgi:ATP-binding cassette subfamily B protein
VSRGRITLDGIPIGEIRLEDLQASIGLVSQDVFLFHGSVRENLLYGSGDATDAQIEERGCPSEAGAARTPPNR